MANIQANIKRLDQDIKRHVLVHSQISAMKTQVKKAQKTKSKKDLSLAYKIIDSALSKGIIKKNKANRLKSRLSLFVNDEKRSVVVETKKVNKKTEIKQKDEKKPTNTNEVKKMMDVRTEQRMDKKPIPPMNKKNEKVINEKDKTNKNNKQVKVQAMANSTNSKKPFDKNSSNKVAPKKEEVKKDKTKK